jgi:uncharacterized protein (UPF0335 family)
MTEYRANTYEDDDMLSVIQSIEKLEDEKASIMAAAMGECAGLAEKIKTIKKEAKDDLSIPLKVLNPILKRRKLERKIAAIVEAVDEDFIEVFEDAAGQFCMFSPVEREDDEDAETDDKPSDEPARTAADDAAEQAEGEAVH